MRTNHSFLIKLLLLSAMTAVACVGETTSEGERGTTLAGESVWVPGSQIVEASRLPIPDGARVVADLEGSRFLVFPSAADRLAEGLHCAQPVRTADSIFCVQEGPETAWSFEYVYVPRVAGAPVLEILAPSSEPKPCSGAPHALLSAVIDEFHDAFAASGEASTARIELEFAGTTMRYPRVVSGTFPLVEQPLVIAYDEEGGGGDEMMEGGGGDEEAKSCTCNTQGTCIKNSCGWGCTYCNATNCQSCTIR